jgi:hypothetical protein
VCPVNDATLVVPFIFPGKLNGIARPQVLDSRREIDVISEEDRLTLRQPDDEALMSGALQIVFQNSSDDSLSANLDPPLMVSVSIRQSRIVTTALRRCGVIKDAMLYRQCIGDTQQTYECQQLSH